MRIRPWILVALIGGGALGGGGACSRKPDPGGQLLPSRQDAPTPDRCRLAVRNSRRLAGLRYQDPIAERQELGRCLEEATAAQVECVIRAHTLAELRDCEELGRDAR